MQDYKITQTTDFLSYGMTEKPTIGIITGTGMGDIVNHLTKPSEVDYREIPNFVSSTVESHRGKLVFGKLEDKNVVVMQGRFHYYEGYSPQQITFPIRVMKRLGVKHLILTNAAGSLNPNFKKESIMLIDDHINLIADNPLRGTFYEPRFPDMSQPYNLKINQEIERIALQEKIPINRGVFVAVEGPNLETSAEYKYLRIIGADAVGMSTVPEVIVANQCGIKCTAFSILTDEGFHDVLESVSLSDVIEISRKVEPKLIILINKLVKSLGYLKN